MVSDAIFICNVSILGHINVGSQGDLLAVVEVHDVIAFSFGHIAKEHGHVHTGSHEHALDAVAVIIVVEAVVSYVDIQLEVHIVELHLVKDVTNNVIGLQLTAGYPEGEVAKELLELCLEPLVISQAVEGEEIVTIVKIGQGIIVPLLGDGVHENVHELSELLSAVEVNLSVHQVAEMIVIVAVADEILQLAHGYGSVHYVEVITIGGLEAIDHTLDGIRGSGRLIGLSQDELHLLVSQIHAEVSAALDLGNGDSLLQPGRDLLEIGGVTLEAEGNRPAIRLQTVGLQLELIVAEGLIGNAAHLHGSHMGEAIHGVGLVLDKILNTVHGYETIHLTGGHLIQHSHQVIQGIAVHGENIVAVDAKGVDTRVNAGCGNIIHQRLDLGLELATVFNIEDGIEHIYVISLACVQSQHYLLLILVNDSLEHIVGGVHAVRHRHQLLSQGNNGTFDDGDLIGVGGSLEEGTAIPTDKLTGQKSHFLLGRILEHIGRTVCTRSHGDAVNLPSHLISISLSPCQITLLGLHKGDKLIGGRHLLENIQNGVDSNPLVLGSEVSKEGGIIRIPFSVGQERIQLQHFYRREVFRILLVFLLQLILREIGQGLAVQREITLGFFKEDLHVPQSISLQLKSSGGQHRADQNHGQHENRQSNGYKPSHAFSLFDHNIPPVIHIFHCFTNNVSQGIVIHILSYHEIMQMSRCFVRKPGTG